MNQFWLLIQHIIRAEGVKRYFFRPQGVRDLDWTLSGVSFVWLNSGLRGFLCHVLPDCRSGTVQLNHLDSMLTTVNSLQHNTHPSFCSAQSHHDLSAHDQTSDTAALEWNRVQRSPGCTVPQSQCTALNPHTLSQTLCSNTYVLCIRGSRGGCCAPYTGCKLWRKCNRDYEHILPM